MGNPYSCPDVVWHNKDKIKKSNRDLWKELKEIKDGPKTKLELFEYIIKSKQFTQNSITCFTWNLLSLLNNYMGVPEYKNKMIELINVIGYEKLYKTIPYMYLHGYGRPEPTGPFIYHEWNAYETPTNYDKNCIVEIRRHYLKIMGHNHSDVEKYCCLENRLCDYCGSNKIKHKEYIDAGPHMDGRFDGFSVSHQCNEWKCLYCGHDKSTTSDIDLVQGATGPRKPQVIKINVQS